MQRAELIRFLNDYLKCEEFSDLGPNGLQVEGRAEINKIVTGVSASVELFEKAKQEHADAIIVHHGIIWDFERPVYKGGYKKRVKTLLENDINLLAYHLPLDAHEEIGNNAVIAEILQLTNVQPFGEYKGKFVGMSGEFENQSSESVFHHIREKINPHALIFAHGPDSIQKVGIISGGAQKEVKQAVLQNLDLYITGEVSEHIFHYVKEEGIHFVAAGHYATERFGIIALGDHLKAKFGLDVTFIDIPNPV